ncbi:MAG TPA: amidohydrolase family protein [Geminicoccaceae bacterium]|nr:amidohydrolase family protein [Geminicoccaceae bacterium]
MIPICQAPDPDPRPPRLQAPAGATDTHFHIFGPQERYPFVADRRFTPPDAAVPSYLHLHRTLGLSRGVLVQASGYGTDNRRQLDAARELDIPTRVIVVVPAAITDRELEELDHAGARAVRFIPTQPGSLPLEDLERFADRLAAFGWHLQLMLSPAQLVELAPRLAKLRCDFVIDHMADIRAAGGTAQPAFQALLRLLRDGRGWTKLSAGYHLSDQVPPYPEVIPLAHALVAARPDRLLWGSDWPHANHHGPMPNSTDLFDLLLDWVPDDDVRTRILVDNPARLYGF